MSDLPQPSLSVSKLLTGLMVTIQTAPFCTPLLPATAPGSALLYAAWAACSCAELGYGAVDSGVELTDSEGVEALPRCSGRLDIFIDSQLFGAGRDLTRPLGAAPCTRAGKTAGVSSHRNGVS